MGDKQDPPSDPETEKNECLEIMESVRSLCSREEAKLEGLSPEKRLEAETRMELLKLARQLLHCNCTFTRNLRPMNMNVQLRLCPMHRPKSRGHIPRRTIIWQTKASQSWMTSSMATLWCTTAAAMRSAGCQRALRDLKGPGTYKALKALLRPPRALKAFLRLLMPCMT